MAKIITLVGGPRDGDRIQVSGNAGIIMVPTLDEAEKDFLGMRAKAATDHTIGHAYALQPNNTAKYLGRKSKHEIKAQFGGYGDKTDETDEDDEDDDSGESWKHPQPDE